MTSEASRVFNSCSFMGIIPFPYYNSTKGVKKQWRVEIVAHARQFLPFDSTVQSEYCVYTSRHLIDTYSSFCVIAGDEIFFAQSCSVSFFFFFCSTGYVYSITSLTLSDSPTKFQGNQISHYESYPIFLACIKRCAIAFHNLLSRHKPPPNRNSIEILS